MNLFNFLRSRVIAWYASLFITGLFAAFWLLVIIPLFEGPDGNGDHNGIGLLLGVVIAFIIFVRCVMTISAWLARRYEAAEHAYRDRLRAEEDEWRRTHPI